MFIINNVHIVNIIIITSNLPCFSRHEVNKKKCSASKDLIVHPTAGLIYLLITLIFYITVSTYYIKNLLKYSQRLNDNFDILQLLRYFRIKLNSLFFIPFKWYSNNLPGV